MRRFWLVLALWLVAHAARADDVPTRAEAMLSAGIDTVVPVERFAELGPEVVPALIAIFERPDAPRHVRLRALAMLSALDDSRATARLEALVRDAARTPESRRFEHTGLVLRRALAGLKARVRSALTAAQLTPLLDHADPEVRASVAELMARQPLATSRGPLAARLEKEPSRQVRAALEAALTGRSAPHPARRLVRPESAPPPR